MAFLALKFRQLTAFSNYALVRDSRETWILTDSENYSLLFYLEQLTFPAVCLVFSTGSAPTLKEM